MNASQPLPWKFIFTTLIRFSPLWCGVTMLCGAMGFAYSLVKPDIWEASQPLIVRDEASGSDMKRGRFSSQTDLQAAQETVLEMARNREVVTRALTELGPGSSFRGRNWPSTTVVADVAGSMISVRAPKTSEFGKTEVIYLATKADSAKRAEQFCEALFSALSEHLRDVRKMKAESIIVELQYALQLAQENLDEATARLAKLESSVGTDLGDLRGLSETLSGDAGSSLIRSDLERDIRAAELELKKIESLQELLRRSQDDTNHLLVTDADLLLTQPTLQKLKTGLIDAQLEASKLAGRVTQTHPKMLAALRSQETIRAELRLEIENVIRTMEPALELARRKLQTLRDRQTGLSEKLASLATIRTEYSRLVSDVRNRTEILNQAQTALTEAEALRSAAVNTNLIAALGPPKSGERPVGLGTKQVTVGALAAGLLLGLGGVFLIAPNPNGQRFGRRQTDSLGGRRAADHVVAAASTQRNPAAPTSDRRAVNRLTGEPNLPRVAASTSGVAASDSSRAETEQRVQPRSLEQSQSVEGAQSAERADAPDLLSPPSPPSASQPGYSGPVTEAIAAARQRASVVRSQPIVEPAPSPINPGSASQGSASRASANQAAPISAGTVRTVPTQNHGAARSANVSDEESGTILWSETPSFTPGSGFSAAATNEPVLPGGTVLPEKKGLPEGTGQLQEEIVRNLQIAAKKNKT